LGGIGASFQVLEILMYYCGLKLGSASIFDQNPFFEMASNKNVICGLDFYLSVVGGAVTGRSFLLTIAGPIFYFKSPPQTDPGWGATKNIRQWKETV